MKSKFICIIILFSLSLSSISQTITLNIAIQKEDMESIRTLLQNGEDVNKKDAFGNYPLFMAVYKGNMEIIQLLVQHGANISAKDKFGNSVLMVAAFQGKTELVNYFIDQGAYVDEKGGKGMTALMLASTYDGPISVLEVLKTLVAHGADVNAKSDNNKTALDYAAKDDAKEYLLSVGASKGADLK